jgi:hypothetical protein
MKVPSWIHPPKGVHWTPRLLAGLALIMVAAAVAGVGVLSLLTTLLTFGSDVEPSSALKDSLQKHEQLAKLDRDRFDGRSAFFMPPAPVRPVPKPPPPPKDVKPPEPPAPIIPAEYTGKKPIAVLGPTVYFDSFQVKVGEESNGIKVIATNAPWSVKLGHEGGVYDVPIWPQKKEEFFSGKWPTSRTPGIESSTAGAKDKGGPGATRGGSHGKTADSAANRPGASAPPPGAPGAPGTGAGASGTSSASGAVPLPAAAPGSSPAADPSNAATGTPATNPSDGTPPAGEPPKPIQPPVPAQPGQDSTAAKSSKNDGANDGWNSNQMAPPPPMDAEKIKSLPYEEAVSTQANLLKAKSNPAIDGQTAERLDKELALLRQRLSELKNGQSPPS